MELMTLMAGIEAAIAAAPKVIEIAQKGKELITALFTGGVISASTQNQLHARIDKVQTAFLAGEIPAALLIEPDPESPKPVTASPASTGEPATTSDAPAATTSEAAPAESGGDSGGGN